MLIYQVDNGADNGGKLPSGGVVVPGVAASSMSVTVANPITIYSGSRVVISQDGQSGDLYNYYWTSYSRGTDGLGSWGSANLYKLNAHNTYLDSYIPLRHKSIYDPCPYGYRIPSNGTYNQVTNTGWKLWSYTGGVTWNNINWVSALGWRIYSDNSFSGTGYYTGLVTSTRFDDRLFYVLDLRSDVKYYSIGWMISGGSSVRCIEECEILTEATISKRGIENFEI